MGKSSPLPSCSGSRPSGFDTDTFGPGDRSRMAKSSGAIGSTTRSSGGGTGSRTSRRPRTLSEAGRADTTTTASPSRSTVAPPPKNLPRSSHRSGSPRRRMSTSGHSQNPGVNLDETQHLIGTNLDRRGLTRYLVHHAWTSGGSRRRLHAVGRHGSDG